MVTGVAGCRMVTVCPGTPGAIWLATVWMTRLAAGMVANAMVGFSSKPAGRKYVSTHVAIRFHVCRSRTATTGESALWF